MATKKKTPIVKQKVKYPIVTKGTHLTVTKRKNGKIELKWDWDQLLKEVEEATSKAENKKKD
jgi:hypothetical protein